MTPEQAHALGQFVRERRHALELSTRELAARCGLDMSAVVRLEQGQTLTPGAEKLRKLSVGLVVPAADLLARADYARPDDLPTPALYLRTKYPELSPKALAEAERYLEQLTGDHGTGAAGPAPGEDEA
jgi:transcriptional regulator with XRE-family HTH domain